MQQYSNYNNHIMPSRVRKLATLFLVTVQLRCVQGSSDHRHVPNQRPSHSFLPQSQIVRVEKYRFNSTQVETDTLHDKLHDNGVEYIQSSSYNEVTEAESNKELHTVMNEVNRKGKNTQAMWNSFDSIDKQIIGTTLPLSAMFAIIPVSMALDLFWVNSLGDALAVAGQSAANQVYNSAFWLFSFLPSVTATLVSKSHSEGDLESTQDAVCQAIIFAVIISAIGTSFMFFQPVRALTSILKEGSSAMVIAKPYLTIRAFSFMPMLISFVGFSTFRGTMEVHTSVKLAMVTNILVTLLDPLLIRGLGFGVFGAAIATVSGDVFSAMIYLKLMKEKNLILMKKLLKLPSWKSVAPLLKGGIALQIRSFAMNLTGIMVARLVQSIDENGVAPAAHALVSQMFQLGGIVLGALGMASQTMVPNAIAKGSDEKFPGSMLSYSETLIRRLFKWGLGLGFGIGLLQLLLLPKILKATPLPEVREAAHIPAIIATFFQAVNGVVNVGEGFLMGVGSFTWLSVNIVLAALFYAGALQFLPGRFGLTGVWMSLAIFTAVRLIGVLINPTIRHNARFCSKAN